MEMKDRASTAKAVGSQVGPQMELISSCSLLRFCYSKYEHGGVLPWLNSTAESKVYSTIDIKSR